MSEEEEMFENTEKLKQTIIDGGLYEADMSVDDMKELYKTLNRSKQTAKEEKDYRQLMSQTDLNCSNLNELETSYKADNKDVKLSTTVVSEENSSNENNNDKTSINDKSDFVFNFTVSSNYKPPLMLTKRNKNLFPILYHNPEVLKLPAERKTKIINLFLKYEQKKIQYNKTKFTDQFGKIIDYVPKTVVENNEDINLVSNLEVEILNNSDTEKQDDFVTLRSSRLVKRKNYKDCDGSDDDFLLDSNKKSKSNTSDSDILDKNLEINDSVNKNIILKAQKRESDEEILSPILHKKPKFNNTLDNNVIINKSTPLPKASEIKSVTNKWYKKTNINNCDNYIPPEVSDRTNKLFDKLREEDNKRKPKEYNLKLNDVTDLSDSSDDIFSSSNNIDIHNEITPKTKKEKTTIKRKPQTKTRKKLNLKSNEEENEYNMSEISAPNFYGRNKENEISASNNNETSTLNKIQCPICSKSFPNSEIEVHASRCEQYDDNSQVDSMCVICNQYFSNSEIDEHKRLCIRNISKVSVEKPKNKTNQQFLCEVCDKFILNSESLQHAENCIAVMKK